MFRGSRTDGRRRAHMLMMDENSDQVAALIEDWLTKQGLMQ